MQHIASLARHIALSHLYITLNAFDCYKYPRLVYRKKFRVFIHSSNFDNLCNEEKAVTYCCEEGKKNVVLHLITLSEGEIDKMTHVRQSALRQDLSEFIISKITRI